MGIQINGNNDIISALDGSWTAEGASINTSGILTATTFKGNIVGTAATFTGPVTIGGTLTYEDVTNIDSVGLITARNGVHITGDNKYLKIGAGGDLQFVHTGSETYIANSTGHLTRRSDVHKWENYAGNKEYIRILSDGKVGINSVAPTYGMHLHGTSASNNAYYYAEQSSAGASAGFRLKTTGSHFAIYGATSGSALGIYDYNAGAERLTIDSTGRLLIGAQRTYSDLTYYDDLTINNSNTGSGAAGSAGITLVAGDSAWCGLNFGRSGDMDEGHIRYDNTNNAMIFGTGNGSEKLRITSAGKVGINQSTPTEDLEVAGVVGTGATIFVNAPTHNTNVASIAMLKLGYKHSGGQAVGYFKLTEGGGNSFDGNLKIGVPYNIGGGSFGTRDAVTIKHNGWMGLGCDNPGDDPAIGNDATVFEIRQTTSGNITSGNNRKGAVLRLKHEAQWENGYQSSSPNDDLGRIEFVTGDSSTGEGVRSIIRTRNLQYFNHHALTFETAYGNSTTISERLRLVSDVASFGNDSPPSWQGGGGYYNIQLGNSGYFRADTDSSGNFLSYGVNAYRDGSGWKFVENGRATQISHGSGTDAISVYTSNSGNAGNAITFTEALNIHSDGKIGINEASPSRTVSINGSINIQSGQRIESYSSGGNLIIQGGSTYPGGHIQMFGGSGDDRISFNTSGSATASIERMRLDGSGRFVIGNRVGTNGPSTNQPVAFHSTRVNPDGADANVHTAQRCNLFVGSNSGWQAGDGGVLGLGGSGTGSAGQERMWAYVKGSRQSGNGWEYPGYLDLGTAGWTGNTTVKRQRIWGDGQVEYYPTDNTMMGWQVGGAQRMKFTHTGGGNVSITNSNGTMTYGSTSDYRLKKNESAITNALTTVKALKPYQFTWKSDDKLGQGFFAHEAQAVLPDIGVVTGTKDAVYTEDDRNESYKKDDPDYQAVDYSKLVPLLTAAIQELEARVATLENP